MKRLLVILLALLSLGAVAGPTFAAGSDKVLYNFETGKDGWWTFAKGVTLTISNDTTTGADGSTGSLLAAYQYQPGPMSYMGIGIQPKWAMAGDSWTNYAKGHMVISFKSDAPVTVHIQLRASDKKTYSYSIDAVPSTWKDYTIGFDKFVDKGTPIDLSAADIDQIVIIPSKSDENAHSLWMDNVTLSKDPATP